MLNSSIKQALCSVKVKIISSSSFQMSTDMDDLNEQYIVILEIIDVANLCIHTSED